MKFLTFTMYDVAKTAEVAQASDKVMANLPQGVELSAQYVCLAQPFPGLPPNTLVTVSIGDAESAEALAAVSYPMLLAGASIHRVPILEVPVGGGVETERRFRG